jgi:hypothetical protein
MLTIESLKNALESGEIKELPSFSSIGGYPIYYVSSYNNIYCAECANKMLNDEYEDIVSYDTHMEGESLFCEHGHEIESAYGMPEDENN